MVLSGVQLLPVFLSAISTLLIGILWYSPLLFGRAWAREAGLAEPLLRGTKRTALALSFLLSIVMALTFLRFLPPEAGWKYGATAGALVGVGWVSAATAITTILERRSSSLFLIHAGYYALTFTVMGALIGAFR